ncbi:hypothetical protein GCM10022222_78680 [Amycolatopsis ultiminotia]|uniref:Uncharacterized protein n=1 Tax=Amycolatopsis ultiminotia TaxID=543629 RepID=A0ABP6YG22_9PSEU
MELLVPIAAATDARREFTLSINPILVAGTDGIDHLVTVAALVAGSRSRPLRRP